MQFSNLSFLLAMMPEQSTAHDPTRATKRGVFQSDAAEGEVAFAVFDNNGRRIARVAIPEEFFDDTVVEWLEAWFLEKNSGPRLVKEPSAFGVLSL